MKLVIILQTIRNVEIAFHKYGKDDSMVKAKVYI